ncbi:MAG: AmmeMemoRadiSam system protein B, partial [Planctomycetes bacterium]|nr:AmmeMemoRadiSam system protein B [Planctomycetota bacterium]
CFTPDTPVITDRGPMNFAQVFALAERVVATTDAEIAYPEGLRAVAASGTLRKVRAVFKHRYCGPLTVVRPYYLPSLRCTPDHRVYATIDPALPPEPTRAGQLTKHHYLAIPRHHHFSASQVIDGARVIETPKHYLVPLHDISSVPYDGDVYNMEVEEEHNYLAGFFLVCNCQNWVTSQALRDSAAVAPVQAITPRQMVEYARRERVRLVVSSYNEPLITAEWAVGVFREATAAGLACAFVSNGNATPEVLDFLRPWIVAYKIDLKSFNDRNYRSLGGALDNITRTIGLVHERGLWLEVVTLVIPGFNDSDEELHQAARFLASISRDIPWHVTAFHKDYKMTGPDPTPASTLVRAAEIGTAEGLRFVYAGNLPGQVGPWEDTRCPSCGTTVIERFGYLIRSYNLTAEGRCPQCQKHVPGIWPGTAAEVRTGNDMQAYRGRLPRRVAVASGKASTERLAQGTDRSRSALPMVVVPPSEVSAETSTKFAPEAVPPEGLRLTEEQKQQILGAAAAMLRSVVDGGQETADLGEVRDLPVAGAFVSLKRSGHLRSCCGQLGKVVPLAQALEQATVRTASEDTRFPPISPTELEHLEVEVWLLSNPQPVQARGKDRLEAITIGKHGIQVIRGQAHGLFLPGVAVDHGWDARQLLDHVCTKAGLPAAAWEEDDTTLVTFEGEVLRGRLASPEGPRPARRRPGPCRPEDVPAYAEFCRKEMTALLTGATPSYYFWNAADGTVNGLVLLLHAPGAQDILHFSRFSLRPGLPLQATLSSLIQAAAEHLARRGVRPEVLSTLEVGLAILHDPVLHGTVAEPDLKSLDPRHRAVLVLEGRKAGLSYLPEQSAEELLTEAASQARAASPEAAHVYSLDALTNTTRLSVSTAPRPVRGPAVRPPAVAGTFYEADAGELSRTVDQLLGEERRAEPWRAALVPHAGLRFSGHIAADVLKRIRIPSRVIVLGPKHTTLGVEWAVAPHQTWVIPGAEIASDFALARKLCQAIPGLEMDAAAHQREHAIEIELPFLARLAPEARVVGIAIGQADLDRCLHFAEGLARLLRGLPELPLLLISSDMNHFGTDAENRRLDAMALAELERLDPEALYDIVRRHNISMCGVLPAVIVLETLRQLDVLTRAERVGYATTADVTGDPSRVVGYAGMLFG